MNGRGSSPLSITVIAGIALVPHRVEGFRSRLSVASPRTWGVEPTSAPRSRPSLRSFCLRCCCTWVDISRRLECRADQSSGAALVFLALLLSSGPLLGNLWQQDGIAGNQLLAGALRAGGSARIAWRLSELLAVFAAVLALPRSLLRWSKRNIVRRRGSLSSKRSLIIRTVRGPEGVLALFLIGYAVELVLYCLPWRLVRPLSLSDGPNCRDPHPPQGAEPIREGTEQRTGPRGVRPAPHLRALVLAANSFAYDAARYREGEAAVAMGYTAQTVDAGYEWVGTHGIGPMKPEF